MREQKDWRDNKTQKGCLVPSYWLLISYKAHCNKKCVNGELSSIYFPKIIKQVNQHPLSYVPLGRKTCPCFEHCTFRIPYRGSPTTKSLLGALQIFAGCTHSPPNILHMQDNLSFLVQSGNNNELSFRSQKSAQPIYWPSERYPHAELAQQIELFTKSLNPKHHTENYHW